VAGIAPEGVCCGLVLEGWTPKLQANCARLMLVIRSRFLDSQFEVSYLFPSNFAKITLERPRCVHFLGLDFEREAVLGLAGVLGALVFDPEPGTLVLPEDFATRPFA
jgi:hypothetical protein